MMPSVGHQADAGSPPSVDGAAAEASEESAALTEAAWPSADFSRTTHTLI